MRAVILARRASGLLATAALLALTPRLLLRLDLPAIDMATLCVFIWALLLQILAGLLAFLETIDPKLEPDEELSIPYAEGSVGGIRGGGDGIFWRLYTDLYWPVTGEKGRDSRMLRSTWRPFQLPAKEMAGLRLLLRQLSILSLAVIGLIRFASGEPILNLF